MVVCEFWCGSVLETLPSLSRGLVVVPWFGLVMVHGVDWCWMVCIFSFVVFVAVLWYALGVVRFQSAVEGLL